MNSSKSPVLRPLATAALWLCVSAAASAQGVTERVSLDSFGSEGTGASRTPDVSADGRYVVFETWANLDPSDTTGAQFFLDVYLHDRVTGSTTVVSRDKNGGNPNDDCREAQISDDGRYVVFSAEASDVWSGDDDNARQDVFRWDRITGTTALVSVAMDGTPGDWDSYQPAISGNGRYVSFTSAAGDLAPFDPQHWGIYVRDMVAGTTELITIGLGSTVLDGGASFSKMSFDGRFVTYSCLASNLVPGDTNGTLDVFVHDRQTGTTELVSVSSTGVQANTECRNPSISDDGRFVAFDSFSFSLVPGDTNFWQDVFLRDRQTGQTIRVSEPTGGGNANGQSQQAAISADGRYVAFESWASNLHPEGSANWIDALVYDRVTDTIGRATVDSSGALSNGHSYTPAISANGEFVAFTSDATNLAPNDLNGKSDVFIHHYGFEAPAPDVKINGSDLALTVPGGTPIQVTCGLDAGSLFGQNADWFVRAQTPFGDYWLLSNLQWVPSAAPLLLLQFPLVDFAGVTVLNNPLPAGTYAITFYVDDNADGLFDGTWADTVSVTVQ